MMVDGLLTPCGIPLPALPATRRACTPLHDPGSSALAGRCISASCATPANLHTPRPSHTPCAPPLARPPSCAGGRYLPGAAVQVFGWGHQRGPVVSCADHVGHCAQHHKYVPGCSSSRDPPLRAPGTPAVRPDAWPGDWGAPLCQCVWLRGDLPLASCSLALGQGSARRLLGRKKLSTGLPVADDT